MMKMKSMFNLKRLGMTMSALLTVCVGASLASCDREQPTPNPTPGEKPEGVEVLIDYENVCTGVVTRAVSGDVNYSFTGIEGNGEVRMKGGGFHPKDPKSNDIDIRPKFYGVQNVVFKGWSWRYSDDPKGTHRGSGVGAIQSDFVELPALQTKPGLQMLEVNEAQYFTCKYRPNTDNKVYVKVKYMKAKGTLAPFPKEPWPIEVFSVNRFADMMRWSPDYSSVTNASGELTMVDQQRAIGYTLQRLAGILSTYDFQSYWRSSVANEDIYPPVEEMRKIADYLTHGMSATHGGYVKEAYVRMYPADASFFEGKYKEAVQRELKSSIDLSSLDSSISSSMVSQLKVMLNKMTPSRMTISDGGKGTIIVDDIIKSLEYYIPEFEALHQRAVTWQ